MRNGDVLDEAGTAYARLREQAAGRKPHNDLWIAATALSHKPALLTADERQAALTNVEARLVQAPSAS